MYNRLAPVAAYTTVLSQVLFQFVGLKQRVRATVFSLNSLLASSAKLVENKMFGPRPWELSELLAHPDISEL